MGRELPCMTWEHGLLFTARVERRRVVLRPTLPTHEWPGVERLAHSEVAPFSALPFPDDASVCVSEFEELLKHGVCLEGRNVLVDLRQPKRAGLRSLPCVLCPVVHWPVLLLLVQDGWTVPARPGLHVRPSADLFREHAERFAVLHWHARTPRAAVEAPLAALAAAERLAPAAVSRVYTPAIEKVGGDSTQLANASCRDALHERLFFVEQLSKSSSVCLWEKHRHPTPSTVVAEKANCVNIRCRRRMYRTIPHANTKTHRKKA